LKLTPLIIEAHIYAHIKAHAEKRTGGFLMAQKPGNRLSLPRQSEEPFQISKRIIDKCQWAPQCRFGKLLLACNKHPDESKAGARRPFGM